MSDFLDAARRVGDLKDDIEDAHENATRSSMKTMQQEVRGQIRANDSVARRVLVTDVREGVQSLSTPNTLAERAVHVPEWAKYLEHGTGQRGRNTRYPDDERYPAPGGLPPFNAILTWVIAKNLQSDTYDSKYALAEAIMNTVAEEGTFPHPFLRPVWHEKRGYTNVIEQNKRAWKRAIRRF